MPEREFERMVHLQLAQLENQSQFMSGGRRPTHKTQTALNVWFGMLSRIIIQSVLRVAFFAVSNARRGERECE